MDDDEKQMIEGALKLNEKCVRDVMTQVGVDFMGHLTRVILHGSFFKGQSGSFTGYIDRLVGSFYGVILHGLFYRGHLTGFIFWGHFTGLM